MFPKLAIISVATAVLAYFSAPMAQRILFMLPALDVSKDDSNPIKVGLVGAADIAKFAVLWPASRESSIVIEAVAARSVDKAKAYAAKHGIPKVHSNYQELIMDSEIDVIYIGVITELHFEITQFALQQGKHVLLEKPAVFLEHEAKTLVALAREQHTILFEAFHWRYHPAAIRVQELVKQKVVGSLERIELKASLYDPKASSASEEGADKQFVKLFDRWCYLVDEMHFYLPQDKWSIEVDSVYIQLKTSYMHANLTATPLVDLEKGEGGGAMRKKVKISMDAYKDKLEIPDWSLSFHGSKGTLRYDNALFPFVYHRITKPDGEVEKRYASVDKDHDDDDSVVGKTTFAHQLDVFTSLVNEQDEWKKAKTNKALWSSMIRNAKMAERMVAASGQTPVASWSFPPNNQMAQ